MPDYRDRLEATEVISRDERAGHPVREVQLSECQDMNHQASLPYYGDSIVDCGCFVDAGLVGCYAGLGAVLGAALAGDQCEEPC